MACPMLYNDMASATFGLYENKDDRLPYALFVVSIEESEILVFSSLESINQATETERYSEWIKSHSYIQELSRRPILNYEPYIATYGLPNHEQNFTNDFFSII